MGLGWRVLETERGCGRGGWVFGWAWLLGCWNRGFVRGFGGVFDYLGVGMGRLGGRGRGLWRSWW